MKITAVTDSASIRSQLPATEALAYLNTGTPGPLPSRTHEVMVAAAAAELRDGRANMQAFMEFRERAAALRGMLGRRARRRSGRDRADPQHDRGHEHRYLGTRLEAR